MSMDDVEVRVRAVEEGLTNFNDALRVAFDEVMHSHGNVSPLWDDEMRREYDLKWKPLEDNMHEYVERIGPNYVEFVIARLQHLQNYLHGHGS